MVESTKETDGKYKERSKKHRYDSQGVKCPECTYLRESKHGRVWYARITLGKKPRECNTRILESSPNSRNKAIAWVDKWREELELTTPAKPQQVSPALRARLDQIDLATPVKHVLQYTVGSVTELERMRYEEDYPGSPAFNTVDKRLIRICNFYSEETDVRTITKESVDAYIKARRSQFTKRGKPPIYDTIYRELELFARGVKLANDKGYLTDVNFPDGYKLPIDKRDRRKNKRKDDVYNEQRSHEYSHEECMRWIEACKGTPLEHHVYIAYRTGLRHGELLALCWDYVKLVNKHARKKYFAEIHLPEWLYERGSKLDNQPIGIDESFYNYLEALSKTVPDGATPFLKTINSQQRACLAVSAKVDNELYITLRDLRACFGWRIMEETKDVLMVMRAMRHKRLQTTIDHYLRPGDTQRSAIANVVSAIFKV